MLKKILFTGFLVISLFFSNVVFAQSVGDYRSNVTSGSWTTLSSWQYYNGTAWVTPSGTSPQGYPGQYLGTGTVLIQAGHTISIGNTGISTQPLGTITINGALNLNGDNTPGGINYFFDTQRIIITSGLSPTAHINFLNKVNLKLPANAILQVGTDGLTGGCNNNVDIYIGTSVYAYCTGGGSTVLNFSDLMNGGGSLDTTISSNSPVCESATINLGGGISNTGWTIISYSWSITPPSGSVITASTQNVSITNALSGTYTANLTVTAKYGSSNNYTNLETASVVVNVKPGFPTVSLSQPACSVPTGTITVTSPVPAAGITYTVVGTSPVVGGVTNATGIFSGLTAGSYNVSTTNALGCVSTATSVVINSLVTKIWNGSWSPAGTPTSSDIVVINANYNTSSNGDLNACSLTINATKNLTVTAGKFVIVQNDLTVNGILDVFDQGSLVMVNDLGIVTNNGTTNVRRFTTPFKKYDYTYWSSPVVSTAIASTFLGWNTSYSYEYIPANFFDSNNDGLDDDGNDWSFASTMTPGNGYIIMVPNPTTGPGTNNPNQVVFSGKVNNGVQKITNVIPDSSYLLGNPYPSALDAEAFLDYNAGVIDGTLYFWTHNTAIQLASDITNGTAGSGIYAFTSDDYASYNAVGGVGVGSGLVAISGGNIPTGKIASGQGFFATSNVSIIGVNEIVYKNAMRLSPGGTTLDNSQFFKTKNSKAKTTKVTEKHRVWLNLFNTEGAFKQTLIGYVTGATNENDSRFDGQSFDGNEFIDFYSVNQEKNLVIQGRALPFDENDEVLLGYRTAIDGTFSIDIEQVDGLLTNQEVFIEDKLTDTEFDLKTGKYTFTTGIGTFNDRFVLKYSSKTFATEDFEIQGNKVLVSVKNKQVKINSFAETIDKVLIYDLLGRLIYKKDNVNSNELSIADFVSSNQALIVKTILQNGIITTDKIIY
ncbi:MAG: T9SS sorting signal type C domain-containing protein [Bacteroidota bacterium]